MCMKEISRNLACGRSAPGSMRIFQLFQMEYGGKGQLKDITFACIIQHSEIIYVLELAPSVQPIDSF